MIRISLYQLAHYRDILSYFLNASDSFRVVSSFNELNELERQAHRDQPNIVLLDISMNGGIDVLNRLKKLNSKIKVIILTNMIEHSMVLKCLRYGADGYLLINKTALPRLSDYIKDAYDGGIPMSPSIMGQVFKVLAVNFIGETDSDTLTKRESEVLQLLVNGLTYKEVSSNLNIALDTVRSHIKSIYDKLGVNSKSEAVVKAIKDRISIAW